MASVNGIVSNNCRVQADIRLGQGVADEVVFAFEDVVEPSQGLVERFELSLVSLLLGRKAALVDYRYAVQPGNAFSRCRTYLRYSLCCRPWDRKPCLAISARPTLARGKRTIRSTRRSPWPSSRGST